MLKTKREMITYSFYDWTGWQRHLEQMAAKGWMLDKISNAGARYHRSEPREVQYAVTYCAEASEFNPRTPESQQTFEEFCAEAGWIKVASWHQMQVFRAPVEAPPMDTDALTQVKTVHAAMKKNFLPAHIALAVIAVLQLLLRLTTALGDPIAELSSVSSLLAWVMWILMLIFSVLELVTYLRWHRKANALAWREGKFCPSRSHPVFQTVMVWVVVIMVAGWILSLGGTKARVIALGSLALVVLLMVAATGARALFRRLGLEAGISRVLYWVVCFIASFVFIGIFTALAIRMDFGTPGQGERIGAPLTVGQLAPELETDENAEIYQEDRSPLLDCVYLRQSGVEQGRVLNYALYESPFDWVLDVCQGQELEGYEEYNGWAYDEEHKYHYQSADPTPWGAEEAWLLYKGNEVQNSWLVRWEDRLLWIFFLPGLTEGQMTAIGQILD